MLHPRKVSFFDKAGRTSKRPASAGRFELQGHLQFLQFLASEAFLEAFACLPAFALELSLAAEACLPFALDPVFSMFTPLGDRPVFRLLPVEGSMPLCSWFYTSPAGVFPPYPPCGGIIPPHPLARVLHPRAHFRRQAFISAAPAMKRRLHSSCSACKHAHRTSS